MQINLFVNRLYLYPALITMMTARESLGADASFGLGFFEGELDKNDVEQVLDFCRSLGVSLKTETFSKSSFEMLQSQNRNFHFGAEAFGRILYAASFPEKHIYSDVDVLFFGNLEEIWRELEELHVIGFVPQATALGQARFEYSPKNREFFSGFILWPDAADRPNLEIMEHLLGATEFSFHDQAFLNRIVGNAFQPLRGELCQLDNPSLTREQIAAGIVHYWGNWKPWHAGERMRKRCIDTGCYWTLWFEAESKLSQYFSETSQRNWLGELQSLARKSSSRKFKILGWLAGIINAMSLIHLFLAVAGKVKLRNLHLIH